MIMAAKEKYAEPTYLECGFGELEYKVISPEACCRCGTCEAFCPRIEHKENKPTLVDYDPLCGLCFAYCPRTFLDMGEMEAKLFGRTRRGRRQASPPPQRRSRLQRARNIQFPIASSP
ncbi:MAG: hypothetical protein NTW84_05720 [Methanothrix sp.]|nr:hypothetical protein [Methanothrix sp.]